MCISAIQQKRQISTGLTAMHRMKKWLFKIQNPTPSKIFLPAILVPRTKTLSFPPKRKAKAPTDAAFPPRPKIAFCPARHPERGNERHWLHGFPLRCILITQEEVCLVFQSFGRNRLISNRISAASSHPFPGKASLSSAQSLPQDCIELPHMTERDTFRSRQVSRSIETVQ